MNTNIFPKSFLELFAGLSFFLSVFFALISMKDSLRARSTRIFAILIISSLSVIANNSYCYFAAIFIVATAVTELDFLQNLAAIIRGSKEYFDYKKDYLNHTEVEKRYEQEYEEDKTIASLTNNLSCNKSNKISLPIDMFSDPKFGYMVEQLTLSYFEREHKKPIERNVRLSKGTISSEYDGIMKGDGQDTIYEIKVFRKNLWPRIKSQLPAIKERLLNYMEITRRPAICLLILVIPDKTDGGPNELDKISNYQIENYPEIILGFLTFKDIGLTESLNITAYSKSLEKDAS